MVIANDHYQSIGIVCLSGESGGVQHVAHKRSISFNFLYMNTVTVSSDLVAGLHSDAEIVIIDIVRHYY